MAVSQTYKQQSPLPTACLPTCLQEMLGAINRAQQLWMGLVGKQAQERQMKASAAAFSPLLPQDSAEMGIPLQGTDTGTRLIFLNNSH